jgi:hypothetical protein
MRASEDVPSALIDVGVEKVAGHLRNPTPRERAVLTCYERIKQAPFIL